MTAMRSFCTTITVWDLWDWTLDASIDTTIVGPVLTRSWKGPTVGEVTGDGIMDIILLRFDHKLTGIMVRFRCMIEIIILYI